MATRRPWRSCHWSARTVAYKTKRPTSVTPSQQRRACYARMYAVAFLNGTQSPNGNCDFLLSRRKRRLSKPRKTRLSRVGGLKAHLVDWLQFRTALSLVLSAADSKIKLPAGNVSCDAPSRMARQDWGTWTTCLSCDDFHIFVNSCCHIFSLRHWRCCDIGLVARFRLPRNDKPEIRWKTARGALQ